jgi:L-alanine-DL-glutamate epimerase-like enolase superfamily enzyme
VAGSAPIAGLDGTLTVGVAQPAVVSASGQSVTMQVTQGWNLFGLPLGSMSPISASTALATLLGATNGSLAALYSLTSGTWTPSLIKAPGVTLGHDFAMQVRSRDQDIQAAFLHQV